MALTVPRSLIAALLSTFFLRMKRLDNIHVDGFSEENFARYPVWVWDDGLDGHHPLVGRGRVPGEFGTLFIRAVFTPPTGPEIAGYLVLIRK